ncbi:MAG: PH domain-containing protein [Gemmatimonadetes bacterium]|nr:PH domain-containing protein [Gemmatimonadota bacterium]
MGYVEQHLLPGEQIKHRAHLHKIIYVPPVLFAVVAAAGATFAFIRDVPAVGAILLVVAAIPLLWVTIEYRSSEFAVTDKRVIAKVGWIQRRTLETMLGKVEGIGVDQTVTGRLLGFGTITVTGTGGTKEQFANIASPLEFRRQVQAQISAGDEARSALAPGVAPGADPNPREERDCPYCAERILVRAKVCKHCGRDVEPLVKE